MKRRQLVAALATLPLWPGEPRAQSGPQDLVLTQHGSLPIILTAPHGGQANITGIDPRSLEGKGMDASRYLATLDTETDRLAAGIAAGIKALTGKEPYLVVARFHRKFIDVNRPPDVAYDSPLAQPYYDYYHQSIRRMINEVRSRHPDGLLIDVHGQGRIPDSLVRGTLNGRSTSRLIARAGFDAITGPQGLFGQLESSGFRVFPANSLPPTGNHEDAGFRGGYTTSTYGSHRGDGIDAVQFEFGTHLRSRSEIDSSMRKAARAIVAFHEAYLK
jgi:N-formylglutamate amidohydrolase